MWSVLLGKYTAAKVAPLSLLIPVIGLAIAQIILHESITGLRHHHAGTDCQPVTPTLAISPTDPMPPNGDEG